MEKKEQAKERMRKMRERNKVRNSVTENVTQSPNSVTETPDNVTLDVTLDVTQRYMPDGTPIPPGRLFSPSKFLSEEEDLKVEARVRERLKLMSGSRKAQLLNWANAGFIPNREKDASLKVPEIR